MKRYLLLLLVLTFTPLFARAETPAMQAPGDWVGADLEDAHDSVYLWYKTELGLTEAQVKKLEKVRTEAQEKRRKVWKDLYRARLTLHELLRDDDPSQRKLDQKADQIGSLQGELIKLRTWTVLTEKKVLTKEQLKKFDDLMAASPPGEAKKSAN
jgi:Spy/CpxP family protein refolding chaperone